MRDREPFNLGHQARRERRAANCYSIGVGIASIADRIADDERVVARVRCREIEARFLAGLGVFAGTALLATGLVYDGEFQIDRGIERLRFTANEDAFALVQA